MRCASNGKVWMKMLANGNGGSILAQGIAVFIHWPFYSSIRVLRLRLGLVMAESTVLVFSAGWPGDKGLSSHLCCRAWLGGLWWSGRSQVCSAFGAESMMTEEAGGGHLFQQLWWYHKARSTQMHWLHTVPGICTSNTIKYVVRSAHIQAGNRREVQEHSEFWESSNLICHLIRSGMC